jgi:uncharacterized membrane protein YeaQ/YmgE (transglycosylase-associated protein family)
MARQPDRERAGVRPDRQFSFGIVGGVLGGWIFSLFGLFAVGTIGSIVTSVVGAIVLLWIVAAVGNKKEKKID